MPSPSLPKKHFMGPIRIHLVLTLIYLIVGQISRADDVDNGEFNRGNAGQAENQDSEVVPGLKFEAQTYGGSGCPQGSVAAALTPDQKELSLLFDNYVIRAGGATNQRHATGNCQVKLNFTVPPGYQAQIVKIDYRGFENVPAGAGARISTTFGYDEWNGRPMNMRRFGRWTNFIGPSQQNFQLSSRIHAPPFSPCGRSFTLRTDSVAQVHTNQQNEETILSVDSIDAVALPIKLSMRWKRCQVQNGPNGREDRNDHGNNHGGHGGHGGHGPRGPGGRQPPPPPPPDPRCLPGRGWGPRC